MEKVIVNLGKNSYSINIGFNVFKNSDIFYPLQSGDQAMLVTNKTLLKIYGDKISSQFIKKGIKIDQVILSDGEEYKTLHEMEKIISVLLEKNHNRDTTLLALGGGVVGDLTGFTASIYQRGVRYIQIPTTLLSQVDAAIGGKTAVNHILGKNMIGVFWQPSSVIIDINFLNTLPKRQLISGLAEVIKYAIICDNNFFIWLEENIDLILSLNCTAIKYCIHKCCELKSQLVSLDERDMNDRSWLNLGHTYGHAIEAYVGYGNWLHGEAISVGIVMAARTAELLGKFKKINTDRIIALLKKAGLPIQGPKNMLPDAYFLHMMRDKKVLSGVIKLVIPTKIGQVEIYNVTDKKIITSVIHSCS
ncbi:MAG TPA: 3-dehydroquinate synthase [Buchnera sp. (in: enterobacteria)]|nr:3-dehydroquinate synthase [Buchnera sp. (in: enterobacteria)]